MFTSFAAVCENSICVKFADEDAEGPARLVFRLISERVVFWILKLKKSLTADSTLISNVSSLQLFELLFPQTFLGIVSLVS